MDLNSNNRFNLKNWPQTGYNSSEIDQLSSYYLNSNHHLHKNNRDGVCIQYRSCGGYTRNPYLALNWLTNRRCTHWLTRTIHPIRSVKFIWMIKLYHCSVRRRSTASFRDVGEEVRRRRKVKSGDDWKGAKWSSPISNRSEITEHRWWIASLRIVGLASIMKTTMKIRLLWLGRETVEPETERRSKCLFSTREREEEVRREISDRSFEPSF